MTCRTIIADDHVVVRVGLRLWLSDSPFEVGGEADTGAAAIELASNTNWDLALIDRSLPDIAGVEVIEQLRESHPTATLVLFSEDETVRLASKATLARATVLGKSCSRASLIEALQLAVANRPRRPVNRRIDRHKSALRDSVLTGREGEVLAKLSAGLTNKQIALALGISYETVKEHVQHILHKIGVADRTQAAVWAVRQGIF